MNGVELLVIASVLWILLYLFSFRRKSFSKIDRMNGVEFEKFLAGYFEHQGYHVDTTPKSSDYGADLIVKKGYTKTVVQAKRYNGKVGINAVQEAIGAVKYYKADKAMVVTNSYFTQNAKKLARANNVLLWDREDVKKRMAK